MLSGEAAASLSEPILSKVVSESLGLDPDKLLVPAIRRLGDQARSKDDAAILQLYLVATAAEVEYRRFIRECPAEAAKIHSKALYLPAGFSPLPGIDAELHKAVADLDPGGALLFDTNIRPDFEVAEVNFAYGLLAIMVLVRLGLYEISEPEGWTARCRKLPLLTKVTTEEWWELAKEYLSVRYHKELAAKVFENVPHSTKISYGDAVNRVRQSFERLVPLVAKIDSFHSQSGTPPTVAVVPAVNPGPT